jgi:beta-aspartyl-peptidase (threonine type)
MFSSPCKYLIIFFLFMGASQINAQIETPVIVIHGGAGTIERGMLTDSLEKAIEESLRNALDIAYAILEEGGSPIDAVEATLIFLENTPHFNAGKGAVMTAEGKHELDACIMNGADLNAGAVAGVTNIKNPIKAARGVMEKSPHVLLSNEGAESFARELGLELVDNSYFTTEKVAQAYRTRKMEGEGSLRNTPFDKFGTVGCVVIDKEGNIAAGTSTGGMMMKMAGRIGDSPLIGASTYADNNTCGVSSTGHGEYFIRIGVAKEISDRMEFGGASLKEAVNAVIYKKLSGMGASGGVIAIDKKGNVEMVFNTAGMYRGMRKGKKVEVAIYGD